MAHLLIVKKRALGDSIMGLSSIQYLKSIHPTWKISYAVPAWVYPLYKNTQTAADEIIPIGSSLDFFNRLLTLAPSGIHEMHQSGSSAKLLALYAGLKNIPYTFHNHHSSGPSKIIDQGKPKAAIQRDLDGVHAFWGKDSSPNHLDFAPSLKVSGNKRKRIILGVVATRETKMWPLPFYKEVAVKLQAAGFEVAIPLGPSDQAIERSLVGSPIVKLPLQQLPQYFSESALYVGNDTGIKHLAVSVGIPTLTFFGPENPSEWHPYDSKVHPYFFREGLECRTRTAHYCALATCDSMICLNQFTPEMVYQKILEMVSL
ncbi:MAG: hypothetical protein CME71_02345 [Halobacteriovorax sp.]|nr:hypothetical protein [Halobacteriovorax sp.]